jgi:hypothetical protein
MFLRVRTTWGGRSEMCELRLGALMSKPNRFSQKRKQRRDDPQRRSLRWFTRGCESWNLEVQVEAPQLRQPHQLFPSQLPRACRLCGRVCLCATAQRNGRRRHWLGRAGQKAKPKRTDSPGAAAWTRKSASLRGKQREGQGDWQHFPSPSGIVKPGALRQTDRMATWARSTQRFLYTSCIWAQPLALHS